MLVQWKSIFPTNKYFIIKLVVLPIPPNIQQPIWYLSKNEKQNISIICKSFCFRKASVCHLTYQWPKNTDENRKLVLELHLRARLKISFLLYFVCFCVCVLCFGYFVAMFKMWTDCYFGSCAVCLAQVSLKSPEMLCVWNIAAMKYLVCLFLFLFFMTVLFLRWKLFPHIISLLCLVLLVLKVNWACSVWCFVK